MVSTWGGRREGAGRPRGSISKNTAEIQQLAKHHGPAIVTRLAELSGIIPGVAPAESQGVQIMAMKELLDRGYGRATQPLAGNAAEGQLVVDFRWQDATPVSTECAQPLIEALAGDTGSDADVVATCGNTC